MLLILNILKFWDLWLDWSSLSWAPRWYAIQLSFWRTGKQFSFNCNFILCKNFVGKIYPQVKLWTITIYMFIDFSDKMGGKSFILHHVIIVFTSSFYRIFVWSTALNSIPIGCWNGISEVRIRSKTAKGWHTIYTSESKATNEIIQLEKSIKVLKYSLRGQPIYADFSFSQYFERPCVLRKAQAWHHESRGLASSYTKCSL